MEVAWGFSETESPLEVKRKALSKFTPLFWRTSSKRGLSGSSSGVVADPAIRGPGALSAATTGLMVGYFNGEPLRRLTYPCLSLASLCCSAIPRSDALPRDCGHCHGHTRRDCCLDAPVLRAACVSFS